MNNTYSDTKSSARRGRRMRAQCGLTAAVIIALTDIDYSAFSNCLGETWRPTLCNRLGSSSLPSACPLPCKASGPWTRSACV